MLSAVAIIIIIYELYKSILLYITNTNCKKFLLMKMITAKMCAPTHLQI